MRRLIPWVKCNTRFRNRGCRSSKRSKATIAWAIFVEFAVRPKVRSESVRLTDDPAIPEMNPTLNGELNPEFRAKPSAKICSQTVRKSRYHEQAGIGRQLRINRHRYWPTASQMSISPENEATLRKAIYCLQRARISAKKVNSGRASSRWLSLRDHAFQALFERAQPRPS